MTLDCGITTAVKGHFFFMRNADSELLAPTVFLHSFFSILGRGEMGDLFKIAVKAPKRVKAAL